MALQDKNMPIISITKDDETETGRIYGDDSLKSKHSTIRRRKNRRNLNKKEEFGKDSSDAHKEGTNIQSNADPRTFSETVKMRTFSPVADKKVTTKDFSNTDFDFLSQTFPLKIDNKYGEGLTDFEDLYASDDEDNLDESEEKEYDDNVLEFMNDGETIEITDKIRKLSLKPSPSVSPEPYLPGTDPKNKAKKGKLLQKKHNLGSKKKVINSSQLSPRSLSPHLSDITDTEIIYSDSEDETNKIQQARGNQFRRRSINKNYASRFKDDMRLQKNVLTYSSPKRSSLPDIDYKFLSMAEPSVTVIADKQIDTTSESDIDTENEIMDISQLEDMSDIPPRNAAYKYASKRSQYVQSDATDVENFGSTDSSVDEMSDHSEYLSQRDLEKNINTGKVPTELKVRKSAPKFADFYKMNEAKDSKMFNLQKILKQSLDMDVPHEVKFIEIDGKVQSLFSSADKKKTTVDSDKLLFLPPIEVTNTDTEDLHSSYGSDSEGELKVIEKLQIPTPIEIEGALTDTEFFEGEEDDDKNVYIFRPKTPEPPDYDITELPEPTRELILLKEDHNGHPVTVVLPLGDAEPEGLSAKFNDDATSEVEEMATESGDEGFLTTFDQSATSKTPDLPDLDGGIVEASEVIKVSKKKLRSSNVYSNIEPVTDTEDVYLSTRGKRKKNKPSTTGISIQKADIPKFLVVTDTEDLEFSDVDGRKSSVIDRENIVESDPPSVNETELDDLLASDEEMMTKKLTSVTPDCLHHMSCETVTTLKETNEPLSLENKQRFLNFAGTIPTIHTISPTPDITSAVMTDTDEMFTSADEDGYSRAETVTPLETNILLDDHSSFVHMKHTQLFDIDAPGEAIHIKGNYYLNINDTVTDVEELGFSEDERLQVFNQISVNETEDRVCVCVNSNEETADSIACVCISKEDNALSLTWSKGTSTGEGEDWATKSSTPDAGKLGGIIGEESGSTTTEAPETRERDEIQSEKSNALESSGTTDKPSGSGSTGASPGPGVPPTKK